MSEYQVLTILAAFTFIYSLMASRLERTWVNGAIVYVVAGAICGPACLGLIDLEVDRRGISWLAELTLAVVLFTDSANADLNVLRRFQTIPVRLLLIGLPLTIFLGFGVGLLLLPDLSFFEIALLATMLAPTDAALGKAVVTNPAVPVSTRQSLNAESGLNDGICVPVLLFFLAMGGGDASGTEVVALATSLIVEELGLGVLVGVALGCIGSVTLKFCTARRWIEGSWLQIPVVALSLLCFASAQWLGGSGFIASFVGGMTFGGLTRKHKKSVLEAAEGTGDTLAMLTWFAFGNLLFAAPFDDLHGSAFLYALASLTFVRMLPVFLCTTGLGLRVDTKLFLGWFGPRGLASVVFAVMVLDAQLPGSQTLLAATIWTIVLSVVAHGLSANPLAKLYGKRVGNSSI